jgi:hypothetical protein
VQGWPGYKVYWAEIFRKGGAARAVVKAKRWLLLSRSVNLTTQKKRQR